MDLKVRDILSQSFYGVIEDGHKTIGSNLYRSPTILSKKLADPQIYFNVGSG
jgi:hypothetical protein